MSAVQPKPRMGPVGGEVEPPPLPRRPPPSLADRHDDHPPKSEPGPALPPRNGGGLGVPNKHGNQSSPAISPRPHSMWIASSQQSTEEVVPPFPVPTSNASPHTPLKSSNSAVVSGRGKETAPVDPFAGQKHDPFEGDSRDWDNTVGFYDVPPPPRKAVNEIEKQQLSTGSPRPQPKKQFSDPLGNSSPQPDNKKSDSLQQHALARGYVPPSNSFESVNTQQKENQRVSPSTWSGEPTSDTESSTLKLFPSVDEIERQILLKHSDQSLQDKPLPPIPTKEEVKVQPPEKERERTFSSIFDDPKYLGIDRIPPPSGGHSDGGVGDLRSDNPMEPYDDPLELMHLKSQAAEGVRSKSPGVSPPPLPERNVPKMTVVSSSLAPPLPDRPSGSKPDSPVPMPRSHVRGGGKPDDIPPLPPRNNRARSTSPHTDYRGNDIDNSKKATLPSDGRRMMQSHENVAQHNSGVAGQSTASHLLEQGYSKDEIDRALAVSGGDYQLAQRILKAFGQGH